MRVPGLLRGRQPPLFDKALEAQALHQLDHVGDHGLGQALSLVLPLDRHPMEPGVAALVDAPDIVKRRGCTHFFSLVGGKEHHALGHFRFVAAVILRPDPDALFLGIQLPGAFFYFDPGVPVAGAIHFVMIARGKGHFPDPGKLPFQHQFIIPDPGIVIVQYRQRHGFSS